MRIAFWMDPIESINYEKDTSYFLMLGYHLEGHEVYFIGPNDLELKDGITFCHFNAIQFDLENEIKIKAIDANYESIDYFDLLWIRKDPPFDQEYLYNTILLEYSTSLKIINSPQSLRDWNEKLAAQVFPQHCPKTLISSNMESIIAFIKSQARCTLKPLDGFGGKGIEFTDYNDSECLAKIHRVSNNLARKIIVQEYLPAAKEGDKRVLIWKDQILGAILRVHAEGKELNNLDAGGKAIASKLSKKEESICRELIPHFQNRNIDFVGLDFIGEKLIEVNITSPTGLQQLSKFENKDFHRIIARSKI